MDNRCITGLENLPDEVRGCVLTLGNFDGVHLGHQKILQTARSLADAETAPVAAATFEPPPDAITHPAHQLQRITQPQQKGRLLLEAGADFAVTIRFDEKLMSMSPEAFIKQIIVARFAPRHVVEGRNFFFGRGRAGNVETLSRAEPAAKFAVHVVEPVTAALAGRDVRVSSSLIRSLVGQGEIEQANQCLGRRFELLGRIIAGAGHGRLLEFPTANIEPHQQVCPADGVYAGKAEITDRQFPAAISIGNKPTFGPAEQRTVEAFLIGAEGDYYDQPMSLSFAARLRDQQQFDGVERLKAQIEKDVQRAREIIG
ncbi:MAG: bifunctional riboflavin kinase/FAD synthetase [Planctomycetota bacterium]|nr:bifunctional riboflavin kinase/FAD synthetase [Planctomycetota bacterium]